METFFFTDKIYLYMNEYILTFFCSKDVDMIGVLGRGSIFSSRITAESPTQIRPRIQKKALIVAL